MANRRRVRGLWAAIAALVVVACAETAQAQSTIPETAYVTGSIFVDVKRFSGDPTESVLDGEATGGAIALGTHIGSRWDLQVGLDIGGFSETERPRTITIGKDTYSLSSITENKVSSVTTLLRFRSTPHGRVRLGYLGGLSFVRLHRKFHTEAPEGTPAGLIPRPHEQVDYAAAPTIGIDARIAINEHLSFIPAIYACVFRFGDESGVLVRPRAGVRWAF
jgi:hypothetical protein